MIGTEPGCIHWAQLRWLRTFAKKFGRVYLPNQTARGRERDALEVGRLATLACAAQAHHVGVGGLLDPVVVEIEPGERVGRRGIHCPCGSAPLPGAAGSPPCPQKRVAGHAVGAQGRRRAGSGCRPDRDTAKVASDQAFLAHLSCMNLRGESRNGAAGRSVRGVPRQLHAGPPSGGRVCDSGGRRAPSQERGTGHVPGAVLAIRCTRERRVGGQHALRALLGELRTAAPPRSPGRRSRCTRSGARRPRCRPRRRRPRSRSRSPPRAPRARAARPAGGRSAARRPPGRRAGRAPRTRTGRRRPRTC